MKNLILQSSAQKASGTITKYAILAAVGCGEYESVEAAADKLVKIVDTVEPEAELVEKYEKRYQEFRQIYPALKPVFPHIQ